MTKNPFPIKQINTLDFSSDNNQHVFSNNYNDIYFQEEIGLAEKQHVFLQGNNLPENWQNKKHFTIAETGFGVGLNFLNTLKLWQETTSNQQLDYISCELHPLSKQQLTLVLQQFPQLKDYTQQLLANYPTELIYGFHRLHFKNVRLTLLFADATVALSQLNAQVDAWFLDGFAPSKNPQLWQEKLFKAIANLSHIGTTVATYTVARKIRDNLSQVGFVIKKSKGFGQKREMLTAIMQKECKIIEKQPWTQTFNAKYAKTYTIVGAGVAGLTLANKLSQLGQKVYLIDRQEKPCLETSGNPQAMLMPALDLNGSVACQFHLSAFLYAIKYYAKDFFHRVGVYDIATNEKQKNWQEKLFQRLDLPKTIVKKYASGILYPQAGWLDTQAYAASMMENIENYIKCEILSIKRVDNRWQLFEKDRVVHSSDVLVLACGMQSRRLLQNLEPSYELPIMAKHGEISYFYADKNNPVSQFDSILLSKGYITPAWKGVQTIGATFNHLAESDWYNSLAKPPLLTENHWQDNIKLWQKTQFESDLLKLTSHKSRAGIRATSSDHLPICGAIINQDKFKADYHDICHGKTWKNYPSPKPIENLYVFTALGSRGFTTAPLLAEFLVNQLLEQAYCLPKNQQAIIHPNRFLFRNLIRG